MAAVRGHIRRTQRGATAVRAHLRKENIHFYETDKFNFPGFYKVGFNDGKKEYSRVIYAKDGLAAMTHIIDFQKAKYPNEKWRFTGLKLVKG